MKLRILVIGGGAREHALCLALRRSARAGELFALPGNAGIADIASCLPGRADDVPAVVATAREIRADFVVVGPEAPLCAGLVDALRQAGIIAFGPDKAAAALEGSKAFSKRFMKRFGIPTADFEVFDDPDAAIAHLRGLGRGMVVKADGIAAGKGVVVAADVEEGVAAVEDIMRRRAFGEAGATVVIEEKLSGPEISFHAVCDGERCVALADAQDHKRIFDGDRGPNTGGMGAYSPTPFVNDAMRAKIMRQVIEPTISGMRELGTPFRGVLFAGLMLGPLEADGERAISVLEFNVRFGDPETSVLMARLDGDLLELLLGAATGALPARANAAVTAESAIGVVVAAAGYPGTPNTGDVIEGLDDAASIDGVEVLHAGTARREGKLVSAGGRVLCVTAKGVNLDQAAERAYTAVSAVRLAGSQHRRDIGAQARKSAS